MHFSQTFRRIGFCVLLGLAIVCCFAELGPADQPPKAPDGALYDSDSKHLWNRLHEALFVRMGPDGIVYGRDRLEPLLWLGSKHLLEEKSNKLAVSILEEFLTNNGEKQIGDPLKRAILQRDLWLVFDWLENIHGNFYSPELKSEEVQAARNRLRRPLAEVIRRLELPAAQIQKLPDNYAAAVASGAFPKSFDPAHPDRPFLPNDLFAADGPWVCIGRPDGPIAPTHLREGSTNLYANSAFLLFLKLPAGRAATLKYLEQLRSFREPVMVDAKAAANRTGKYLPNPKLPPLPAGTETALVRRALLVDSSNAVVASPLTESVQIRVYRESPALTPEHIEAALGNGTAANRRAQSWQAFFEFRLSRSLLFAGRAGGLHAVGPDETDFQTPFNLWYHDEFENRESESNDRPFAARAQGSVRQECIACHSLPGVASFNSYFNARVHLFNAGDRPFVLAEMPVTKVADAAVKSKQGRANWAELRRLLEK